MASCTTLACNSEWYLIYEKLQTYKTASFAQKKHHGQAVNDYAEMKESFMLGLFKDLFMCTGSYNYMYVRVFSLMK